MNNIASYADIFADLKPFSGNPPPGYLVDWLGVLTDVEFRRIFGENFAGTDGSQVNTRLPKVEDGEGWFEAVNQVEVARAAGDRLVMVTLGACYGYQATGTYRALKALKPDAEIKIVAVEPEPDNLVWMAKHFRDNGLNPDDHWLVGSAISDSNAPVFFPVGAPGSGAQNCYSTNEGGARRHYVRSLIDSGRGEEALENLLLRNSTGLTKELLPGAGAQFEAEIKLMSAVTLTDITAPFDVVDYLESDIQQSEIIVFPPFMDVVTRKVRRVHIGTHGGYVHEELAQLFRQYGWDIVFDYMPNSEFETPLGRFTTNDGVLSAVNPRLL